MNSDETVMQSCLRDDAWLADRASLLRQVHFADVPQGFPITTRFGIRARNRFGSIGARSGQTIILVNRLFADPFVPAFVVDGTLAHELAHYAHGYGSGLPLLYKDPHRGGVVDKDLERRGLGETNLKAEQWRKLNWDIFYKERCADLDARRTARKSSVDFRWDTVLARPGNRTELDLAARLELLGPRFGYADPPFSVEWLRATLRQTGTSYWFPKSGVVRVHGLLSDPRVPLSIVDYELGYWLARRSVGENVQRIQQALVRARLERASEEAMRWRHRSWKAFCTRHHPLTTTNTGRP